MNALAKVQRIKSDDPVNIEAEQALLGAIFVNNDVLGTIGPWLQAKHFSEPLHQRIFEVCTDLRRSGRVANPLTVIDYLPADLAIGDINVRLYVARLFGEATNTVNAPDYARVVLDLALRRELMVLHHESRLAAAHAAPDASPAALVSEAEARLFEIGREAARVNTGAGSCTAGEAGDILMRRIDGHDLPSPPIGTGFTDLNKIIGGFRRGDLAILAGRPGMMKTQLAAAFAINVAGAGLAVLFNSLEMTRDAIGARLLGDMAWQNTRPVAHKDILDQTVPMDRVDLVRDAVDRLRAMPIIIDPRRGLGVAEICFRIRRWAAWHRRKGQAPGLVIIDHLGKIRPSGRTDNRAVELGDITTALADEAGESDVPILCLCQLNRAAESRDNKRPQLSDLRESGRIEEDARVVIGVYRESYYLTKQHESDPDREMKRSDRLAECKNDLEAVVLKNNHGPEGVAKLWVHLPSGAIRDREYRG